MNFHPGKFKFQITDLNRKAFVRVLTVTLGIFTNIGLSFLISKLNWPIYLDTIGTITVSAFGGIFPGIMTAVLTNSICMTFNHDAIYFTVVNAMIAIYTARFVKKYSLKTVKGIARYTVGVAMISTVLSTVIQWLLFKNAQNAQIAQIIDMYMETTGTSRLILLSGVTLLLNIVDKWLSVMAAITIIHFVPENIKDIVLSGGWRQKPLSREEMSSIREWNRDVRHSIRTRITILISGISLALVVVMSINGFSLFYSSTLDSSTQNAASAANFASEVLDSRLVDNILTYGVDAEEYTQTQLMFSRILESSAYVKYLYSFVVRDNICYVVVDAPTEDTSPAYPGEKLSIEDDFFEAMPAMLEGREPEPIETYDKSGWMLTVYRPVFDEFGNCICFIGADVSMDKSNENMRDILLRMSLTLIGFFMLILVTGMWVSEYMTVYPINTIAQRVDEFVGVGNDQKLMDQYVRKIRQLDIKTGDEIEKMYHSICEMASATAEQMRDIRYYGDTTSKMQTGLIITMADLVESRDSDTGSHIQKTAAYVKIVMDGLKDKGYYAEKLTPKFMEDVVMSAPLHDVGKINIPDAVLNKPGKLTDEEYEIMKTHTTCGKAIMEKAISSVRGEGYLKEARNMAAYHHERWDGKGYPEGLHGEIIPLSARIMSVADVFDALTSARVYKPAFSLDEAIDILTEGSGTQFDPKCVEAFLSRLPDIKKVLKKYGQL